MPDFFDLSRHFTPEERTIQSTVRAFVDARVLPTIGDWATAPLRVRGRSSQPAQLLNRHFGRSRCAAATWPAPWRYGREGGLRSCDARESADRGHSTGSPGRRSGPR